VGLFPNVAETAYAAAGADGRLVQPRPEAVKVYEPLADQYIAWQRTLHQAFSGLSAV
jgi:hypothetical protein